MVREALAAELSSLSTKYIDSSLALEAYVKNSFRDIDRNRATTLDVLESIRAALSREEPIVIAKEPIKTLTISNEEEAMVLIEAVSDYYRRFDAHPRMLLEMSLIYASTLFDAFISDMLLVIFRHIPERLRSKRTLTAEEALRFADRSELIEDLANREIFDLMYKSTEKQFVYFRDSFGVDVFADISLGVSVFDLAAVRERRNLIVHNNGRASASYVARYDHNIPPGDLVVTDERSAESDRIMLRKIALTLALGLKKALAPKE